MEEEIEKYCPQCRRMLPPDIAYCPFCGSKAITEIERPETVRTRLTNVGHAFALLAGLVSLITGIAYFGAAFAVSWRMSALNLPGYVRRSWAYLVIMCIIMSILCVVASACSWDAALHRWRREGLKSTVVKITFQTSMGIIIVIESFLIQDQSEIANFLFALGFLTTILSLPALMLTTLTPTD